MTHYDGNRVLYLGPCTSVDLCCFLLDLKMRFAFRERMSGGEEGRMNARAVYTLIGMGLVVLVIFGGWWLVVR